MVSQKHCALKPFVEEINQYNLLDILVCSIVEYFLVVVCILMIPMASSNYKKTCKTCKKTSDCFFILLSLSTNFSEGRKNKARSN